MKEKIYKSFHLDEAVFSDIMAEVDAAKKSFDQLAPLSLDDTTLVLEGEFVPAKPGKEIFMAKGVADGYDYVLQANEDNTPLSEEFIKDVHSRTALDNQPRTRGVYRTSSVYLRGSDVVPANPLHVREFMGDLFFAYENSKMHPLIKAAAFHAMFENIHPFQDGNGRTGRSIINFMLLVAGYQPIALKADAGGALAYSSALQAWQLESDPMKLIELISHAVLEEYKKRETAILQTREATIKITGTPGTFEV